MSRTQHYVRLAGAVTTTLTALAAIVVWIALSAAGDQARQLWGDAR